MTLPDILVKNRQNEQKQLQFWDTRSVHEILKQDNAAQTQRSTERFLESSGLLPPCLKLNMLEDEFGRSPKHKVVVQLDQQARQKRFLSLVIQLHRGKQAKYVLFANDGRSGRRWVFLDKVNDDNELLSALTVLAGGKNLIVWPHGEITGMIRRMVSLHGSHDILTDAGGVIRIGTIAYRGEVEPVQPLKTSKPIVGSEVLSNLDRLEAESIHIMREVVSQADNPVMLYSLGKDSSVMLHLAKKAFYPSPPPFPLLHIDTGWKFQAMYDFRDEMAISSGMDLIIHVNPDGLEKGINPFDHGSALHTDVMKTEGLIQALDRYQFDVAFGGARRDEEKSRAKERVFSFRTPSHRWDPKNQRPEIWNLYNGHKNKGEGLRVFPLSNWTELEIWQYIYREQIPIVPLYYAAERPVVERDGMLLMVDDDRIQLFDNEPIQIKRVRFRTLGCYPLTGAIESEADDLPSIILELLQSRHSERQGRSIDHDSSAAMEKKKLAGYF